ncbi:MAG: hypothetical protein KAI66_20950 [Lentisphaeria bacterium]|nr:hypothetical protein [Lentisphaeria bacterium]
MKWLARALCLAGCLTIAMVKIDAGEPIQVGNRRELFVDHFLIDTLSGGARLRLHSPTPREIAVKLDAPWEGIYSGYSTVLNTGNGFRLYYRGFGKGKATDYSSSSTCIADSADGIHWTKPKLGLFEVDGTKENNVVLTKHAVTHNFAPFVDTNPDAPANQRYKALGGRKSTGLIAFASPDGIHWKQFHNVAVFRIDHEKTNGLDSQNNAFWSQSEKQYVCYFRIYRDGGHSIRWVARTTSKDFIHWTKPVDMELGGKPREQLYTAQIAPYLRAPHIYLGMPTRFFPNRRVLTEEETQRIGTPEPYLNDSTDILLTSSRSGMHGGAGFKRTFLEAFIRPGLDPRNWTSRANYAAKGIIQTSESELSFYVNHNCGYPTAHLRRYTIRPDGFVSVYGPYEGGEILNVPFKYHYYGPHHGPHPKGGTPEELRACLSNSNFTYSHYRPHAGGEMVTKPLVFSGKRLTLNFSTSAGGGIHVEIQTPAGAPLNGFAMTDCPEIIGDRLEYTVAWEGGSDVSRFSGKPVRLRFLLRDADLYSIRFAQ